MSDGRERGESDANRSSVAGLHLLVVEDQPFQRAVLVRMLASLEVGSIVEAEDGRAALGMCIGSDRPFDVVLTDIDMPDMDGLAFIRNLSSAQPRASIIITSSLDRALLDSIENMCTAYGARLLGTIEKPVARERLVELISRHRPVAATVARPAPRLTEFTLGEIEHGIDNREFEPFFQPKVALDSGRVKGAEALARWRHPRLGVIGPQAFVALLETHGRIANLTWLILASACRRCLDWRAQGLDLNVSVNLSAQHLADVSVADSITREVAQVGLEPRHVILEITESAAMTDVGRVMENLSRLRMRGFGLSIDDYGTGYSSMQQLTRVPFTEIKIDRTFVAGASHHESRRLILESSLDMARKLRVSSVAEGVETSEEWDLLRAFGCDLAQGYVIARPMEGAAFVEWVRRW